MVRAVYIAAFIWCQLFGTNALSRVDPLVDSKSGLIRGLSASDGDYSMFLGIPYATVESANPFGHSIPHSGFESTFDAFKESDPCPQIEEYDNNLAGSLNCLHLNVYVPNTANSNNPQPVMVWIHGGGLRNGSGGRYTFGPKFLVRHDVIVVTVNYRLGPYGFLCLDIPEVPGNQGLKDQLTALRWVKNNIEAFGGDPNKITIFGESAGASSVDYHLLFAEEKLFQNVIIQSGSALAPISLRQSDPSVPLKLADQLGYATTDLYDALQFLGTLDTDLVIAAASEANLDLRPCVEKEFDNVERYITDLPVKINVPKAKNVPILVGFNSNENGAMYGDMNSEEIEALDLFSLLNDHFNFESEYLTEMEHTIRHFYIGDEDINENTIQDAINFVSDFIFYHSTSRSINKYIESGANTIYHYMFSYSGSRNFIKSRRNITLSGAFHADELSYLFAASVFEEPPTIEDQLLIDRITNLWTNFAKFSNPTPETTDLLPVVWPVLSNDDYIYLDIDSALSVRKSLFHDRIAFWDLFYKLNGQLLKVLQDN